jgi:hypothetical protein
MHKESDLLPWILGGLSIATVTAAIMFASGSKALAPSLRPAGAVAPQMTSAPALQALPAPAALSPPTADPPAAAMPATPMASQTAYEPPVASGQIWECTTHGTKTFSNNPCGEKSSLVEVQAINTMSSTPPVRYPRAYGAEPRYSPQYADQNAYSDDETYADEDAAGSAGNSYAVIPGFAIRQQKRIEHLHRPPSHHNPGPPPRRN